MAGSNADTLFAAPLTVVSTNRSPVTEPVSGSASICCVTAGLSPPMPNCVSTIHWLFIALSIDVATDVRAEAANTVMKATSATPIISAEAVAAVRFGFRVAFSRASVPAMPRNRGSGEPTIRANGPAMTGPRIAIADEHDERTQAHRTRARTLHCKVPAPVRSVSVRWRVRRCRGARPGHRPPVRPDRRCAAAPPPGHGGHAGPGERDAQPAAHVGDGLGADDRRRAGRVHHGVRGVGPRRRSATSIDKAMQSDWIVDTQFGMGGLSPAVTQQIDALPETGAVTGLRFVDTKVGGSARRHGVRPGQRRGERQPRRASPATTRTLGVHDSCGAGRRSEGKHT